MNAVRKKRVGISTGGGDCPGLNAVIRAVYRTATQVHGWEAFGIEDGLEGLIDLNYRSPDGNRMLDRRQVRGILGLGGTILGTSNKSNPFAYAVTQPDGSKVEEDVSAKVIENARELGLDAIVVIGGDGSMGIAHRLWKLGMPIVGVPKTIDNDLKATDTTFGFDTAINITVEALDRLHTTAASHDRVMVVEVMGRDSGFIALHAGVAGSADVIVIPEMPYSIDAIVQKINQRKERGSLFSIVVVAEGAVPVEGGQSTLGPRTAGSAVRLGGIGHKVAAEIAERIEYEVRTVVLGHLQRGGSPTAFDRLLGTRYGVEAMNLVAAGRFGRMVSLKGLDIVDVSMEDAAGSRKHVDPHGQLVRQARSAGVSFGTDDD